MSDEKVDAWMPLWIGAYLADTMHLSRDSHGGYLLLLFAYWRNRGPLPDDEEDLAGITKSTPAEWKKLRPRLARFFTIEDGTWSHTRADKELVKAGQHKAAAVSKAKAGAQARWDKHRKDATGNAPSIDQALPKLCTTPTPTTPPSSGSEPNGSAGADAPPGDPSKPEAEARRQLWSDSAAWLVANGLTTGDAKAFMNTVAKEYAAVAAETMREAMAVDAPVDPKAWVLGVAKRLSGERAKPITVASDAADRTADLLREHAERAATATKPPAALVALVRRTQGEAA